ncbi:MAG: hypothetical protein ACLFSB_02745 [Chitinispirillaceae bacterium]
MRQRSTVVSFTSISLFFSGVAGAILAVRRKSKTPWYRNLFSLKRMHKKTRSFTRPVMKKSTSLLHSIK